MPAPADSSNGKLAGCAGTGCFVLLFQLPLLLISWPAFILFGMFSLLVTGVLAAVERFNKK
jgi:hypothetical protein